MKLRDSGRDLVQIKDDGTHVILPATPRPMARPDRARLPVMMMLRHAHGKMRRDAIHAARMQRCCAVAERGDCSAHRGPLTSTSCTFWRASEGLVVAMEKVDNG